MGKQYSRVGVGVMIINSEGKILLCLRQGSHGAGEWSFPGGGIEFGDTMEKTVKKEVKEETNLEVDNLELVSVADERRYLNEGKQYVMIGFKVNSFSGELKLMEPDKFVEWNWFSLDNLPSPLFSGTQTMIISYQTGKIYQHDPQ